MTELRTSETLNLAADLIQQRGWTTGSWDAPDGGLCLEGAINAARGMEGEIFCHCPAADAVRSYLGTRFLWAWNDHLRSAPTGWVGGSIEAATAHGTERVIETLRAAALVEQAREESAADMLALMSAPVTDAQVLAEMGGTA